MITYFDDKPCTIKMAQELVDGYVEMFTLDDGRQMIMNEEGRLKGMPLNMEASDIAQRHIVGNVVILSGKAKWT